MKDQFFKEIIPSDKGSYGLILQSKDPQTIRIGKLGEFSFLPGFYFYLGSATGSGGLFARIHRHSIVEKKKFWHIDYLRPTMNLIGIFYTKKLGKECEWVQKLLLSGFFTAPVKKFGASDCRKKCISHLLVTTNNSFIENFPEYLHKSNIQFEQLFLFSWD